MKLSVFVVTYNQEKYIRQCLDGILMQKTDFPIEVLIGEDCSTDNTASICDEYASKYPNIVVFHHKTNIGLLKNWEFIWNQCKGEYIAMVEGDDFWIDPNKLQMQVDYLEKHPDCVFSFTSADIKIEEGGKPGIEQTLKSIEERDYTAQDLFLKNKLSVLTSTVVSRRCLQPVKFNKKLLYADHFLFMKLFEIGIGHGFNKQTATYRVHSNNLSRDAEKYTKGAFRQDRFLINYFPDFQDEYQKRIDDHLSHLVYFKNGGWKYRLFFMWKNPKLIFSRFSLTTLYKYILKR